MSPLKDKDSLLALMVGIVLITAVVLVVMAFLPLKHFSSEKEWTCDVHVPVERLDLSVEADVCDVRVNFADLQDSWVEVTMKAEGRSGYLVGNPDINFTAGSSLDGANLTVTVVLDMYTGPTVTYVNSYIAVIIDRELPTYLGIEVDVGDAVITVPRNGSLNGADIHTDVGGLHLHMEEGATVLDDLNLVSDVGSVNLDGRSVLFGDDVVVTAETGTGSIHLDLVQHPETGSNVTFECLSEVGSVYLTLMISGNVSAIITSQVNVGDIETELLGFSGMDVHLLSDNHPDTWNIELLLEADVGSVHIDAEWRE
jgi:hypothetical protein